MKGQKNKQMYNITRKQQHHQLATDLCYDKDGSTNQRISQSSLLLTYMAEHTTN